LVEPGSQGIEESLGKEINSSGKQFFDNVVFDNILESMVELTAAVWTYKDRTMVLERVLESLVSSKGELNKMIESYELTDEDKLAQSEERKALISNVFRSFSRRPKSNLEKDNEE
tara:strand:- start:43 stop:387 length:345 start_codon:yes stop_codon:yes gene_type:complete